MSRRVSRRRLIGSSLAGIAIAATPLSAPASVIRMPDPTGYRLTRWAQDRFAYGSYSYLARGAHFSDRVRLADPVGNSLFFAGEATESGYPATVHGALLSGQRAAWQILQTSAHRIAVVGAGFAGLGAARALADAARQVTVIEARDRIGGRVHTDRSLGLPLDLGASWIHGVVGNPLTDMANSLNVPRVASNFNSLAAYGPDGSKLSLRSVPDWFWEHWEVDLDYAANWSELSPLASQEGSEVLGPHALLPAGYDSLIPALTGGYDIRMSSPVRRVTHRDGKVHLDAPSPAEFDAALITVPLGVLKSGTLQFEPELPPKKQRAIDRLGFGLLDKLYLKFDTAFWPHATHFLGTPDRQPHPFAHWVNLMPILGTPVICAFNGAATARDVDDLPDDELLAQAMIRLRYLLADT